MIKELTPEEIWETRPGEIRKPGLAHFVMFVLFTGIGIVVGTFGSLAIPLGFVSAFWPGQAVQTIGGIWFGMWGAIAGTFFPLISNALSGSAPLPVSIAYIPANFVQSALGMYLFRKFKLDPRLTRKKDWMGWVFGAAIVANAFGAFWGSTVLLNFGLITRSAYPIVMAGWFVGNTIPTLILGTIILKYVSPLVIRSKAFCKGYWA